MDFHHTKSVFLDDYEPLISINRKKYGDGVAIVIEKSLQTKVVNSYILKGLQALTMRVNGNLETVTYVSCMYIPPNSVNAEFLSKFQCYIDSRLIGPQSYNIVYCDFNINFSKKRKERL